MSTRNPSDSPENIQLACVIVGFVAALVVSLFTCGGGFVLVPPGIGYGMMVTAAAFFFGWVAYVIGFHVQRILSGRALPPKAS